MKTGGDDWKTPLGVYERAIIELTKAREEMQAELEKMKAIQASQIQTIELYQKETQTLKKEIKNIKIHLNTVQKIADESRNSKEALKEALKEVILQTKNVF